MRAAAEKAAALKMSCRDCVNSEVSRGASRCKKGLIYSPELRFSTDLQKETSARVAKAKLISSVSFWPHVFGCVIGYHRANFVCDRLIQRVIS